MTNRPATADRLQPVLSAMLDGQLTDGQIADLRRLLRTDPAARRQYIRQVNTHVMLQWTNALPDAHGEQPAVSGGQGTGGRQESSGLGRGSDADNQQSGINDQQSFVPPIILDLSPAPHSPFFTLHSPVGAFFFSYLMGALLLGIGLLVGLAWRTSRDQQVVHSPVGQTPTIEQPASETPLVAGYTGTADCHWTDPKTEAFDRDGVPLGRKFALASGFIEITYARGPGLSCKAHARMKSSRPPAASFRLAS